MLRTEDPLADGQQRGELVPGGGHIPRLPGPAGETAADGQGVRVHALSLSQPMIYWAGGELAQRVAETYNDALADAHRQHPKRLVGLATLPMHEPELAQIHELLVAARELWRTLPEAEDETEARLVARTTSRLIHLADIVAVTTRA